MSEDLKRLIKCRPSNYISRDWQASRVRFTHNEIERKRRARLKSETDFLHQQLPRAVYRDKLAIFRAGTELLHSYAECNGPEPRSLIITDREYSACIFKNFDGFGLRVRCRDGQILSIVGNWKQCLGDSFANPVGKTLYELILPNETSEAIVAESLTISQEDSEFHFGNGQSLARSFVLPLVLSPSETDIILVECCGDIVLHSADREGEPVEEQVAELQVLCRILEKKPYHWLGGAAEGGPSYLHSVGDVVSRRDNDPLFSLRLRPESYLILEISGRSCLPRYISPSDVIGQLLVTLAPASDRPVVETNLQNAERTGEADFVISLAFAPNLDTQRFRINVKPITVGDYIHCLVADFFSAN